MSEARIKSPKIGRALHSTQDSRIFGVRPAAFMKATEIRQSFLNFFREKQHTIVPSSSLLPNSPNLLFTNAGMNQFVPYFLGRERAPFTPPRAADTQKCIRAGGKHNDLDDVGFDTYHHTFFEMLGNWSFGDYFKKEAIGWAWELLVERWKFPVNRLYTTVYRPQEGDPAEFDQEAYDEWSTRFQAAGLDPKIHIVDGNKKDNFWMMGDTGPCGPCSEVHVDLTSAGDTRGKLVNMGSPLCIEIWNLVFIQFNANADGSFSPLPARHVDTGMGFERVAGIIECTDGFRDFARPISNYDSDVFAPIFHKLSDLTGKSYRQTLPESRANLSEQEKIDVAFRVVADHLRTLSFSIADRIIPSNTDRNYVLRRILRRAVLFGRYLGFGSDSFLSKLVPTLVENFGSVFPELKQHQEKIGTVLDNEEALFNATLDRGLRIFETELTKQSGSEFSPEVAFKLYDTYGFPIDLTEVLVRERGLTLDLETVQRLMDEQRRRSQGAQIKEVITAATESVPTEFVGFYRDEARAQLVQLISQDNDTMAIVDRSPLYAEMGGQVSDKGVVQLEDGRTFDITSVTKQGRTFYLKLAEPAELETPAAVFLKVDQPRRRAIEANHTATHLLHWALHEVVSKEISQKGSYVGPDRLRFDFNNQPLTVDQMNRIEELINTRIIANDQVSWLEVEYETVKGRPDIMQFFGEKYGADVRVVQIGGNAGRLDGYSMELCGGTHVLRTGQLGLFKIVSEGAIQAGVRRIEALTGLTAFNHLQNQLNERNKRVEELNRELVDLKKSIEKERAQTLQRQAEQFVATLSGTDSNIVEVVAGASGEYLQTIANTLKAKKFGGIAILFGPEHEQIHVLAYVDQALTKRIQAGKVVQELTALLGGKGGGRPDLARGVGRDISKLEAAKLKARELIAAVG
jgi:alanyl-tRNA synthetase